MKSNPQRRSCWQGLAAGRGGVWDMVSERLPRLRRRSYTQVHTSSTEWTQWPCHSPRQQWLSRPRDASSSLLESVHANCALTLWGDKLDSRMYKEEDHAVATPSLVLQTSSSLDGAVDLSLCFLVSSHKQESPFPLAAFNSGLPRTFWKQGLQAMIRTSVSTRHFNNGNNSLLLTLE